MASIASTTTPSSSSLDGHSDSELIIRGAICRKSYNQEDRSRLTIACIHSANRELDEISSAYASSITSSVDSSRSQNQFSDAFSLAKRQTVPNSSLITSQFVKPKDDPTTYRVSDASPQRTVSSGSGSAARIRELWYRSFFSGCWSNTRPDFYAARVVSFGPWTDRSTPNLLAKMFRTQYSRAFANPWIFNTGTLRIIKFLEAVGSQLKKERDVLLLLEFRVCVRQSALDAFHLSIDLATSDVLSHACYLGAIFRHGLAREDDLLCALARIARLAKRLEYFQAFYYLLIEAGTEFYSQPCAMREIRQHAWVLRDSLTDSDEPASSLRWHILIDELIETYEPRSHPYRDPATGEVSWFR